MAAKEENSTSARLAAFQLDLDAILEKHQFQELYEKIIEENSVQQVPKKQINKKAIAAYKKNQDDGWFIGRKYSFP